MYKLYELLEEEYEVNLFDLPDKQEALKAALEGNSITIPELTKTEPADVIVKPSSYDQKDKTRTDVHLTYQALKNIA
ncbi:16781_t:CDS:2 [Cetraspora pellucida]|uniref:16781_t:CDS:1 n=1 Tax=Cetraspora pellucida TaxID=1433469 RepID=A0ACA9K655_9GLOM|nr:16781_t:CDS:2 [Cetraspora pellucida]